MKFKFLNKGNVINFKIIYFCLAISLSILSQNCLAKKSNKSILYQNQHGSTMTLIWESNFQNTGSICGTFITAVGSCKKDINVPLPLIGYFNGSTISVSVNFPHCNQVVTMTGNVSDNFEIIHTIWLDAKQANDPQGRDWNSSVIGSDLFQKVR